MVERLDSRYSHNELKIELNRCSPYSTELDDKVSWELNSNKDSPIESCNSSTLNRIGHKTQRDQRRNLLQYPTTNEEKEGHNLTERIDVASDTSSIHGKSLFSRSRKGRMSLAS